MNPRRNSTRHTTDVVRYFVDRRTANVSDCGTYRFHLSRTWDAGKPPIVWLMLNPSTADAERDDPTIRRCLDFTRAWGGGRLVVVNLSPLRATDPRAIKTTGPLDESVMEINDAVIQSSVCRGERVIVAWGCHGRTLDLDQRVCRLLATGGRPLVECLGTTKHGGPRHPLYVAGGTELVPFDATQHREVIR